MLRMLGSATPRSTTDRSAAPADGQVDLSSVAQAVCVSIAEEIRDGAKDAAEEPSEALDAEVDIEELFRDWPIEEVTVTPTEEERKELEIRYADLNK